MNNNVEKEARRRVNEKAKFYKHLTAYIIVNAFLTTISLLNGHPFAAYKIGLFWGFGLLFHYLKIFGIPGTGILSKEWEDKEIDRETKRIQGKQEGRDPKGQLELRELDKRYNESDLV